MLMTRFLAVACLVIFSFLSSSGQLTDARTKNMMDMQVVLSFDDGLSFQTSRSEPNSSSTADAASGPQSASSPTMATQIRVQLQDEDGANTGEQSPNNEGK